jgi:RHS repeat-associated protein
MSFAGETTYFNWDNENGRRIAQGPADIPEGGYMPGEASQPVRFAYDNSGNLVGWTDESSDRKCHASYVYDASGQRVRSVVERNYNWADDSHTVTTTDYLYEGSSLLCLTAELRRGPEATLKDRWRISYLYDASGRPYGGVYTDLHPTGNETGRPRVFFCLTDQRGDVVELLNGSHEPIVAYRYDIWGNPRAGKTEAGLGETLQQRNVLRYAGYVYDDWNGLYYLQSRYYDPQTRSFLSRDPAQADGLESPYQYCQGRPVTLVDPTGLMCCRKGSTGGSDYIASVGGVDAYVCDVTVAYEESITPWQPESGLTSWGESLKWSAQFWKHPVLTAECFGVGAAVGATGYVTWEFAPALLAGGGGGTAAKVATAGGADAAAIEGDANLVSEDLAGDVVAADTAVAEGSAAADVGAAGGESLPTARTAADMIRAAKPVGSGLKNDAMHSAGAFGLDEVPGSGSVFWNIGGDGVRRILVQVAYGSGRCEWLLEGSEYQYLSHCRWVEGGGINGLSNIK